MNVIFGWVGVVLVVIGIGIGIVAGIGVGNAVPAHQESAEAIQFRVFVDPDAPATRIAAIKAVLDGTSDVSSCAYLDHEQSYQLMKQLLADEPQTWVGLTPAEVPPVFSCAFRGSRSGLEWFAGQLDLDAGVYDVTYPALHPYFTPPAG